MQIKKLVFEKFFKTKNFHKIINNSSFFALLHEMLYIMIKLSIDDTYFNKFYEIVPFLLLFEIAPYSTEVRNSF